MSVFKESEVKRPMNALEKYCSNKCYELSHVVFIFDKKTLEFLHMNLGQPAYLFNLSHIEEEGGWGVQQKGELHLNINSPQFIYYLAYIYIRNRSS